MHQPKAVTVPSKSVWPSQGIVLGCICFTLDWGDEAERATAAIMGARGSIEADSLPPGIQFARIAQDDIA